MCFMKYEKLYDIESSNNLVEVGKITKSFGLKGEVLVIDFANDYSTFMSFKSFFIFLKKEGTEPEKLKYFVEKIRKNNKRLIIKFENVNSINEAENLKNCSLFVLKSAIKLKKGEYLFQEFIGCDCYYQNDKIGTVIGMPNYGTCDMFEIQYFDKDNKIIYVPYFKEIIEKIDIDKKLIYFKEDYKYYI